MFAEGCRTAPLLVRTGTGVVWRWGWGFDWVGDVRVCLREAAAWLRSGVTTHCLESGTWPARAFGVGLLCEAVWRPSPCAGAESGSAGEQLPSEVGLADCL